MACIASGALMLEKFGVCASSPRSACRLLRHPALHAACCVTPLFMPLVASPRSSCRLLRHPALHAACCVTPLCMPLVASPRSSCRLLRHPALHAACCVTPLFMPLVASPRSSCRLLRPHASRSIHCFWMHILNNFGNRVHQSYHADTAHCAFQSLCGSATALWACVEAPLRCGLVW
jgi:small neutral amino acid transporter SnatA (MarC family)